MSLDAVVSALRTGPLPAADAPLGAVRAVLGRLLAAMPPVDPGLELPHGRYLVHAAPAFNLQLDVFSRSYTGGIHRHGTWGAFGVLRGALEVEDYGLDGALLRLATVPAGGGMAFAAANDWHRVATGAGPQVLSLHVYGPGFDLDEGEAIDLHPDGAPTLRRYRRSPFGSADVLHALTAR